MPGFKIAFTPCASDDLKKIDQKQQKRILDKLEYFSQTDEPLVFAIRLSGVEPKTYRFRIGKCRVFFDIKDSVLRILNISLRDKAYR